MPVWSTTPGAGRAATPGCGCWATTSNDLLRLAPEHVAWIEQLPAVALVDRHLLVHSDTARYLEFGSSVAAVDTAVRAVLTSSDRTAWREFCGRISARGDFRDAEPARADDAVSSMLGTFGGDILVPGHSTLTKHFGVAPQDVSAPLRYAAGRVINLDGGVYEGGRILLARLV